MRLALLLACFVLLTGCSKSSSDAAEVFRSAFPTHTAEEGVEVLHGYRVERRRFFVIKEEMWRLHLGGERAIDLVRARWPDLEAATMRSYVQGSQTPWFAPGRDVKYVTLTSKAEPAVMVMLNPQSEEVFIAYDGL